MRPRSLLCGLLCAIILISGCAHKQEARPVNNIQTEEKSSFWAGRISLRIQSEPVQAFFAAFELKGQPDNGELTLVSPLGSILGIMRWAPGEALLIQGNSIQRFASTGALLAQTTGAAVPISALFDWLDGKNTPTPGWLADLSQQSDGRITATRVDPAPQADLRIVLDK